MALFVEVDDVEKGCKVIINLDSVMEVAPLRAGGCELFFPDAAAVGGKRSMKVKDSYPLFKQFAMQQVSAEDIARVNGRSKSVIKEKAPVGDILGNIPTL
jgi:hypothetical protein